MAVNHPLLTHPLSTPLLIFLDRVLLKGCQDSNFQDCLSLLIWGALENDMNVGIVEDIFDGSKQSFI